MFLVEWMLALWLLTGAEAILPPSFLDKLSQLNEREYQQAMVPWVTLALKLELMDRREKRYVLARPGDFVSDLQMLRRRYAELHDAPFMADSVRFPKRVAVNELLVYNRFFRNHLKEFHGIGLVPLAELAETRRETDALYQVWDCVRDAGCEYYYTTVRRQALQRLRQLLGASAYSKGQLPPHLPVWRLQVLPQPMMLGWW